MTKTRQSVSIKKTFRQKDFDLFAGLSGDDNPIHVDTQFSSRTRFGRTVSHGILLSTVLRGLIDRLVPGARQYSQQLVFPAPTFAGDELIFEASIQPAENDRIKATLSCTRVADGVVTCQGETIVRTEPS